MKRIAALSLLLGALLTACAAAPAENGSEEARVVVFAAGSLTEALTEIGEKYGAVEPGVQLIFSFDSSGALRTRLGEGAECDLFLSAAPKQMNEVEELGLLVTDSRVELLESKVVLAVPEGNPAGIDSYDMLAGRLESGDVVLAIGNSDVPVGQYTQKIFDHYSLKEKALNASGVLTYGSNVKEIVSQLKEGSVDCGIIYATDAFSAGLTVVDTATAEMCGQVIYPAAVLNAGAHQTEAQVFLDYLTGSEAGEVFSSLGFTPLG